MLSAFGRISDDIIMNIFRINTEAMPLQNARCSSSGLPDMQVYTRKHGGPSNLKPSLSIMVCVCSLNLLGAAVLQEAAGLHRYKAPKRLAAPFLLVGFPFRTHSTWSMVTRAYVMSVLPEDQLYYQMLL